MRNEIKVILSMLCYAMLCYAMRYHMNLCHRPSSNNEPSGALH
jgi:hypothetical protein